ncbi:hypothetical protein GAY28_35505, partial [Azospirillum brasilense]|nr:hypothetical protein [Azospirillum brasilense]
RAGRGRAGGAPPAGESRGHRRGRSRPRGAAWTPGRRPPPGAAARTPTGARAPRRWTPPPARRSRRPWTAAFPPAWTS